MSDYSSSSSSFKAVLPARIVLSLIGTATAVGGYLADWNETHVFNPKWSPHAKFHNGQTMSTGLGLGLLTWYYTWRSTNSNTTSGLLDNLMTATLVASLYWATQLSAILYPGTKWVDDEFKEKYGEPQKRGAPVLLGVTWAAFGLGWYRLTGGEHIRSAIDPAAIAMLVRSIQGALRWHTQPPLSASRHLGHGNNRFCFFLGQRLADKPPKVVTGAALFRPILSTNVAVNASPRG
ncbi:hypothetical protein LTR99_006376 [Exophiala xenobiotica]|uniref:Uncharacterized protein n=1 Tax=Vermiconidia calcicola TaxID=1690605 RepID=A0AAV9QAB5_9PEZI|nr:hypothetical protein LTR99_006376 [Exophiala xenobiotica]KAK5534952.1 hypothetical protein LTR23_008507 [Chaetothyriales sp. CCFEE 6169]KAK5537547.1 hypothetical protein LTR25_004799 [Vermiconidia calcicola]